MQGQKGKPAARRGRKVMGLITDRQTAEGYFAPAVFFWGEGGAPAI